MLLMFRDTLVYRKSCNRMHVFRIQKSIFFQAKMVWILLLNKAVILRSQKNAVTYNSLLALHSMWSNPSRMCVLLLICFQNAQYHCKINNNSLVILQSESYLKLEDFVPENNGKKTVVLHTKTTPTQLQRLWTGQSHLATLRLTFATF